MIYTKHHPKWACENDFVYDHFEDIDDAELYFSQNNDIDFWEEISKEEFDKSNFAKIEFRTGSVQINLEKEECDEDENMFR